jgi:hypothetical protein
MAQSEGDSAGFGLRIQAVAHRGCRIQSLVCDMLTGKMNE